MIGEDKFSRNQEEQVVKLARGVAIDVLREYIAEGIAAQARPKPIIEAEVVEESIDTPVNAEEVEAEVPETVVEDEDGNKPTE